MGCTTCDAKISAVSYVAKKNNSAASVSESGACEYSVGMMREWRLKLICAREKGIYEELNITKAKINSALGIVVSAINVNNACLFAKYLPDIQNIIFSIINTNKC